MEEQTQTEAESLDIPSPRYFISQELAEAQGRSLASLIASRRCYSCQQGDEAGQELPSDPQQHIDCIADHCAQTADYLLPDTPLKEAIFRTILANKNRAMTAEEISETLSEKWAMTAYPRDLSPWVIQRLLDNSHSYCIQRVPEVESADENEDGEV